MSRRKNVARTSISFRDDKLKLARRQAERMGYPSLSEYLEFLVERDVEEGEPHILIRDASGTRYAGAKAPVKEPTGAK